ncbi:hypothetical protein LNP00_04485 [Fructobacillus sp. M158]|uniref:hypothetical protein n=1 Tax=Fructobacillus parabroussonetiae TaxID=2713174 RepID=UPI00200A8E0D|nr:hypothetical protein [Fructobacillus parabroussonetiae]MCK8617620.1 hypothetical protein [Fructobacillus parabroussonetiae]
MFPVMKNVLLRGARVTRVRPTRTSRSYRRRSTGFGGGFGRWIARGLFWSLGWHIGAELASFFGFFGLIIIIILVLWFVRRRR